MNIDQNLILDDILVEPIFVCGLPRSGKTFFTNYLLESLTDTGLIIDDSTDTIISLFKASKIQEDIFKYLFGYNLKKIWYERFVGRRLNIRPNDQSSIFNSKSLPQTIERLNLGEKHLEELYSKSNNSFKQVMLLHSVIAVSPEIFEIFPNSKFINVISNPYSLFVSWMKNGYGSLEV